MGAGGRPAALRAPATRNSVGEREMLRFGCDAACISWPLRPDGEIGQPRAITCKSGRSFFEAPITSFLPRPLIAQPTDALRRRLTQHTYRQAHPRIGPSLLFGTS